MYSAMRVLKAASVVLDCESVLAELLLTSSSMYVRRFTEALISFCAVVMFADVNRVQSSTSTDL